MISNLAKSNDFNLALRRYLIWQKQAIRNVAKKDFYPQSSRNKRSVTSPSSGSAASPKQRISNLSKTNNLQPYKTAISTTP
jgi:hypothetical protein